MKVIFYEVIIMKLFGHVLVFTICLTLGISVFNITVNAYQQKHQELNKCKLPASYLDGEAMQKSDKSDEWEDAYQELNRPADSKVEKETKQKRNAKYSSPDLGEPALLRK